MKKTTTKKTPSARKAKSNRGTSARPGIEPKSGKAPVEQTLPAAVKATKKDAVLALLQRKEGATLDELMTSTGWQAHSVRGFISGTIRKKEGLTVVRLARDDGSGAYHAPAKS